MRSIVNISLPPTMMEWVKEEMKARQFTSVSEFFRDLIRFYEEERLLRRVRRGQKEIADGKGIVLNSWSDLDEQ